MLFVITLSIIGGAYLNLHFHFKKGKKKKERLVFPWSTLQSPNYFQLYMVVSFKLYKLHPFSLLKGNFVFGGRLSEDQFIYCIYYLLLVNESAFLFNNLSISRTALLLLIRIYI